ncbi:hypothetical protein ACGYLO_19095 [Sulfitobacter sp. 1A13353]|uniref:hypothetical protein n=1 Tax=Sulfitobacter sp. 1A13353 TaxID=3368568 RepID=UPI003747658D
MAFGKYWGHLGAVTKFEHAGWYIQLAPFEFTDPEDWKGLTSWRYRMSRNKITPGVWTDKNPRGRKFETRCFTSREEVRKAAMVAAEAA